MLSIQLVISRVRFLGYAGVPVLLAVPSFLLSTVSAFNVLRTHLRYKYVQKRLDEGGYNFPYPVNVPSDAFSGSVGPSSYAPERTRPTSFDQLRHTAAFSRSEVSPAAAAVLKIDPPSAPSSPKGGRTPIATNLPKRSFHLPLRAVRSQEFEVETTDGTYDSSVRQAPNSIHDFDRGLDTDLESKEIAFGRPTSHTEDADPVLPEFLKRERTPGPPSDAGSSLRFASIENVNAIPMSTPGKRQPLGGAIDRKQSKDTFDEDFRPPGGVTLPIGPPETRKQFSILSAIVALTVLLLKKLT